VPGALGASTSEGTNRLLRDGAHVALEPADLLAPLGLSRPEQPPRRTAAEPDPRHRRILAALREAPSTPDELALRLRTAPEILAPDLLELELGGAVAQERDGRLHVVPRGRGGL
jgi:DNA processing protein